MKFSRRSLLADASALALPQGFGNAFAADEKVVPPRSTKRWSTTPS